VSEGDVSHLTKVSGIGKKNAEKIVIELKDKVDLDYREQSDLQSDVDALEALKSLGYSLNESRDALKKVSSDSKDMSEKIKQALKFLGR
jgi:holliday junction DNA helicase RuvA